VSKRLYSLSVGFSSGGGASQPAEILAGHRRRRSPLRERSSLSQHRPGRSSLLRAGPTTATRSSYACVRSVSVSRLLGTVIAASRRTTSITTGLGFGVAAVSSAGGPSPSYRCTHSLTPITAWWRAATHCCGALWSTVRGKEQCRSSRMRIACRIARPFAAGRRVWIVLRRHFRFCPTL
jgi:hypothetical protein